MVSPIVRAIVQIVWSIIAEGGNEAKVRKGSFLDSNHVYTILEGGRKSFGVKRMTGCSGAGNGLVFGIDYPILRSPGPSHVSKCNKKSIGTFLI